MSAIIKIKPLGFPWETSNPFLFCAYHHDRYPRSNGQLGPDASLDGRMPGQDFAGKDGWNMYHGTKVPGFPAHPHYGFETVTIAQQGIVDHSDSLGASGRFGNGDVQWMTAGSGVQHSEMFPLLNSAKENPLLLFQIWLNLPGHKKKSDPHFKMLWNEDIPKLITGDNSDVEIKLIAGSLENQIAPSPAPDSWAADPDNEVAIWIIKLAPNAMYTFPNTSEDIQRSLYFYQGDEISSEGYSIPVHHQIITKGNESLTLTNHDTEAHLLLLQGKPIQEPVVQQGPFVTNSHTEMRTVIQQFQRTQFGGWPWSSREHTHHPESDRFAIYPNGEKQYPESQ